MNPSLLPLTLFAFLSCHPSSRETTSDSAVPKETEAPLESTREDTDVFCDSTKITGFKNNLTALGAKLTKTEQNYQDEQAKEFISRSCEEDTLFCGEIRFKLSKTYRYDSEWKVLLTGYVLDQETGMEENSASFFVLTVLRNNEPWFTDYLADLMGEIQVDLSGLENGKMQLSIWGRAYPYFEPDYGKFRLTIDNGAHYEYECHTEH